MSLIYVTSIIFFIRDYAIVYAFFLQARRYTIEDKMFCIGIYRRSRSSYKYLSKYLLCPSTTTLDTQLRNIPLHPGCNNIMIKYLSMAAKEVKSDADLFVVLLWDEMSIQPAVCYNKKEDSIVGFEDWGMRRTRKFADHAIMFYMRCLLSGNHMPLGYGFCNSATNAIQLVRSVKQWLMFLIQAGFKPVATVCDQGTPNIACINLLVAEANKERQREQKKQRNTFIIKGQEIVPLYDYVHLQKGVRNNLLTKDLLLNKYEKEEKKQYASWMDIQQAYEMDQQSFLRQRQMPKLTKKHVIPELIPKMKVKYATQILSHTVANFMDVVLHFNRGVMTTKVGEMVLPPRAAGTADVILFFDDLFDSFNGKKGQGLTSIISTTSNHLQFWQEAMKQLRGMEYVEQKTHKVIRKNGPKCLKNWMWIIKGTTYLWTILQRSGLPDLNLKHINQDVMENCFSQIRDQGHRNNNPTPQQFSASFKTLLCTNLTSKKSLSSNCEESEEGTSLALLKMFRAGELAASEEDIKDIEYAEPAIPQPTRNTDIYVEPQKIVKNLATHKIAIECSDCAEYVKSDSILREIVEKIKVAQMKFPYFCYEHKVKEKLAKALYEEEAIISRTHCSTLQQALDENIAGEFITAWCAIINNILNGRTEVQETSNFMLKEARRMCKRFEKKSSTKSKK